MANDVRAGGIYTEFTARTDGLEAAARRSGVIVKRSADEIERETRRASRAVSGMGGVGAATGGAIYHRGVQYASAADFAMNRPVQQVGSGVAAESAARGFLSKLRDLLRTSAGSVMSGASGAVSYGMAASGIPGGGIPPLGGGSLRGGVIGLGTVLGYQALEPDSLLRRQFWSGQNRAQFMREGVTSTDPNARIRAYEDRVNTINYRLERSLAVADPNDQSLGGRARRFFAYLGSRATSVTSLKEEQDALNQSIADAYQQNQAERLKARRIENRSFVREQQENQTSGRFSFQELIMANRENTEVLNLVASRLQR